MIALGRGAALAAAIAAFMLSGVCRGALSRAAIMARNVLTRAVSAACPAALLALDVALSATRLTAGGAADDAPGAVAGPGIKVHRHILRPLARQRAA